MRIVFLTLVFVIVSSFSRGNFQADTVTTMPMTVAIDKTNTKVDSIFEAAAKPITYEQFNKGLLGLMQHMDTLQVAYFLAMQRADSIETERHKQYLGKMTAIEAFYTVQEKYQTEKKVNQWRDRASNIFFSFIGSFAGIAFFAGVIAGIKERKRVIQKSKHGTE